MFANKSKIYFMFKTKQEKNMYTYILYIYIICVFNQSINQSRLFHHKDIDIK